MQIDSNDAEDAHPTRRRDTTNVNDASLDNNLKRKRDGEKDPKLQEYLSLMGSSSKTRTWANDDEMIKPSVDTVPVINQPVQEEEIQELPSHRKKAKTENPPTVAEPEQPEPMVIEKSEEEEVEETPEQDNSAEPEVEAAPVSDADWLRSKTSRLLGLLDEEEQDEFDQHKAAAPTTTTTTVPTKAASPASSDDESPQRDEESRTAAIEKIAPNTTDVDSITEATPEDPNIDLIRNSARLFLRNLAYDTTESDLQPIFERFGKIEEIHIAFDTRSTTSKGFAYVQYSDADAAVDAYQTLDGKHFQGRLLHILPASAKKTYKIDEYELSKLPLKKQREIKRKQNAAGSSFSWNSLYMNVSLPFFTIYQNIETNFHVGRCCNVISGWKARSLQI